MEKYDDYEELNFFVNGYPCTVIKPDVIPVVRRWVWRTEFLGAFDYADMELLKLGWHICYCKVSNMFGCPESINILKQFHDYVVNEFNLYSKADVFGFSRGGLYAFNYALKYPNDVNVLYLDAPVLDLRSWPLGLFDGEGDKNEWQTCAKLYSIKHGEEELFSESPLNHLEKFLSNNIPVVLVAGDSDTVVPFEENGAILAKSLKAANADCKVIVKPGIGHHPHSLSQPNEIVEFIKSHI